MMFQGCFTEVARAVEECFKGAEKKVSRVFQGFFKEVSRVSQESLRWSSFFKGPSFLGHPYL